MHVNKLLFSLAFVLLLQSRLIALLYGVLHVNHLDTRAVFAFSGLSYTAVISAPTDAARSDSGSPLRWA